MGKGEWTVMVIFTTIGVILSIIAITVESVVAKWIWGVLAVAVFAFTIYGTIEGIVKNRRKPKDMADVLAQYLKEESKKPDFAQKMAAGADAQSERRDLLYKAQQPYDADFGYSCTNPIMTSSVWSSDKYLANLRTLDGKQFTWERLGSRCVSQIGTVKDVMVDEYQLKINNWPDKVIYICPYGHNGSFVPQGLTLQDKIDKTVQSIYRIYPSFDFEAEKKNPTYLQLIKLGIGMQEAYEIVHKDKLLIRKARSLSVSGIPRLSNQEAYRILCDKDAFLGTACNEVESDDEIQNYATREGITFWTAKAILQQEREYAVKKADKRRAHYLLQSHLLDAIYNEYPQFDLTKEMSNKTFANIVQAEIGVQLAFEVVHIEELFVRKAQ